jgi:formate hydrogenlyase subunit 6/NADH:ubiquinone oxidoreductase subunit I
MLIVEHSDFENLFSSLKKRGYTVFGPVVRDSAILFDEILSANDLPVGWHDEQHAGSYRLKHSTDTSYFGFTVGPYSWKKFLFPPILKFFTADRTAKGFDMAPGKKNGDGKKPEDHPPVPKIAFVGVRPCDLSALLITDTVLTGGPYNDPHYKTLRDQLFIVTVNCGQAGGTCFCASMGTGPKATKGFDLALTEVVNGAGRYFVVETGSDRGTAMMKTIPHKHATDKECEVAGKVIEQTTKQITKTIETTDLKQLLEKNYDHLRWDDVANRCLSCANCTMVCPTCFCTTTEDVTDLSGNHAERWRKWDSCFSVEFSYIHGGSIRGSTKSRYRQWMMHKLSRWVDQFGTFGCVGCGRCITWCPVGIDITEEARNIRDTQQPVQGNLTS